MEKTDLERFVELYASLGIKCKVNKIEAEDGRWMDMKVGHQYIVLGGYQSQSTDHKSFEGYPGFHSIIIFDSDGRYLRQGFWE